MEKARSFLDIFRVASSRQVWNRVISLLPTSWEAFEARWCWPAILRPQVPHEGEGGVGPAALGRAWLTGVSSRT